MHTIVDGSRLVGFIAACMQIFLLAVDELDPPSVAGVHRRCEGQALQGLEPCVSLLARISVELEVQVRDDLELHRCRLSLPRPVPAVTVLYGP